MAKNSKIAELASFDSDYIGGRSFIVGIDEAGRGCLAGPVYAAAMAISAKFYSDESMLKELEKLNDSKQLSHEVREEIYAKLERMRSAGVIDFEAAYADVDEIERDNILRATQTAMARAATTLNERLGLNLRTSGAVATLFGESALDISRANILLDGREMKNFPYAHRAVVKGDASSLAIAAASIIAKVSRDKLMDSYAQQYPRYAFEKHKGYGTALHLQALMLFGPCPIHRKSFLKKLRPDETDESQHTPEQTSLF